jgi:hypothetical protein
MGVREVNSPLHFLHAALDRVEEAEEYLGHAALKSYPQMRFPREEDEWLRTRLSS